MLPRPIASPANQPTPLGLRIHTLGSFRVYRDGALISESEFKTQKNRDLLKILLTYRGHGLSKDQLSDWLWPNLDPDAAGRSLRIAVSHVRHVLEPNLPHGASSSHILTTESGYGWNLATDYWLDAEEFERLARSALEQPSGGAGAETLQQLQLAVDLYRGDYLEDDRYADWAAVRREELRELRFVLLIRFAELSARQGRYRHAIALCRQVLAEDPCRESVWCQLMLYHYHAGDQSLALRAYQECRDALAVAFAVDPLPETAQLHDRIRLHQIGARNGYPEIRLISDAHQPPVSLGASPFVGREQELAWLVGQRRATLTGRSRTAVIEGEAGIGKSRLLQEFLRHAREQRALTLLGSGHQRGGALPLQPIVDALRSDIAAGQETVQYLDPVWRVELSRLVPEWGPPGGRPPPVSGDPGGGLPPGDGLIERASSCRSTTCIGPTR